MTLKTSLHSGLLVDNKESTLTKWASAASGPNLLADFNFATPVAANDFTSSYATQSWDFQTQTVAGKYDNGVGSATLDNTGGLTDQTCMVPNGTTYTAYNAWEADGSGDKCAASSTSICQPNATDFAVRAVFRMSNGYNTSDALFGNYTSKGHLLYFTSSSGIRWTLKDTTAKQLNKTGVGQLGDGGLHYVECFYDTSGNISKMRSDVFSEVTMDTTGETDFSTTNAVGIGNGAWSGATAAEGIQFLLVEYCEGANSENFYNDSPTLPGTDPTGLLTTQTRASLISVPVSATAVAHFSDDALPIGYNANFTDTNKLGLYCNSEVTNLCLQSEDLNAAGAWNDFNTTRSTSPVGDAPDGFRSAYSVTAIAANGAVWDQTAGSASTEYTFSVWVKRNGGSNVAGRIKQYDVTNANFYAETTFTATDTWQLVTCTGTTGVGCAAIRHYMYVDTNTESLLYWGAQHNLGDARGAYIRTSGASAATAACSYRTLGSAGEFLKSQQGECEAIWVASYAVSPSANASVMNAVGTGSFNRIMLRARSSGRDPNLLLYNSAGGLEADLRAGNQTVHSQQNTALIQWDSSGGLAVAAGADGSIKYNADTPVNDIGSYTATDSVTTIHVGNNSGGAHIDGYLQRVRIWDGER